jgi:hypothetical protein
MSAARRTSHHLRPLPAVAAVAALTIGLLAGCTSGGGSASSAGSGGGSGALYSADAGGKAAGGGSRQSPAIGRTPAAADRAIVRNGTLELTAKDPIAAASAIASIVTGSGGRVDNLTEDPTGDASSSLTARIPADVFDSTLAAIKRQGTVRNVALRANDVTSQVTDYRVRIKGLDDSITRLQGLLGKASTTTELVQIESTLTDRETEREQLLAQQQALKDQVTYATLAIVVHEPSLARSAPPSTFLSGLLAGWETLVAVGAGLLVGLGVVLPWAIALGALAVVGLLVARLVRRVRRRAATPA